MYKNIVFDGGGARGVVFCGAIKVLEKEGIMKNITNFAGTSVGSIVAAGLAIGYTGSEMETILLNKNFDDFKDNSNYILYNLFKYFKNYGWYRGNALMTWVEKIIEQKTGNPNITLGEVYTKYGNTLVIVGTNLNNYKATYFNPIDNPDMKLKEAIRISTSIPFFFDAYVYEGQTYIDGGLTDSYPFGYFQDDEATIGFKLKFKLINRKIDEDVKIVWMKDYLIHFLKMILNRIEQINFKDYYWKQTVEIDAMDVGMTEFEIPLETKICLISAGKKATKKYLKKARKLNELKD